MSKIRPSKSTMSHVRPYWLPLRIRVLIARSNSGTCEAHFASITLRSFFSSDGQEAYTVVVFTTMLNRTRINDLNAYQSAVPRDEYLRSLLAKQNFIVLVALADDRVVGGLAAYVLEKFEQERLEIYIYDLAVARQHRRKGIATKLINNLRQIARERR